MPTLENAWTADLLWAIYELEAPIRESDHFVSVCLAKDTSLEGNVECSKSAFRSPLDLLLDYSNFTPGQIKYMSQDELDYVLSNMIKDEEVWVLYKHLFDSKVSKNNLNVQGLRSELLFGSPIRTKMGDSYDRYEDLNDRS